MRILELRQATGRTIGAFGSQGFSLARLSPSADVVCAQLQEGGVIGRHDAVADQLFVVLAGQAVVSGADGTEHTIGPSQAALWVGGEAHHTRAATHVSALIIEAEGLADPTI